MKSNAKFVAICLAVMFVLVLMCGVLVACNKDESNDESDSISGDISDGDLEHIIGYVATEGAKDGQSATAVWYTYDKDVFENIVGMPYKESYGEAGTKIEIFVEKTGEEDFVVMCDVFMFQEESQAKAFYDDFEAENAQAKLEGKMVIAESEDGVYKNTILKTPVPATYSKTRMDFIKDSVINADDIGYTNISYTVLTVVVENNYKSGDAQEACTDEYAVYYIFTNDNYIRRYSYHKIKDGDTDHDWLYGDSEESYVDTERESGYVFVFDKWYDNE